jgi:hypothetical protein
MPTVDFNQVVEIVKALNPAEQWRLRDLLDVWLEPPHRPLTEEEFERLMVRKGILSVPPPLTPEDIKRFQEWKPVELLKGKPVSETIIAKRR